jgi:DNA-binding response OmpR family regulator
MTDLDEKIKVLIADPNHSFQLILTEDLEKAGYEVDIAKDFKEYEEKAGNFDIAILDMRLPGLNIAEDVGPLKTTLLITAVYDQEMIALEQIYSKYDNIYEYVKKPYFASQIVRWCRRIEADLKCDKT